MSVRTHALSLLAAVALLTACPDETSNPGPTDAAVDLEVVAGDAAQDLSTDTLVDTGAELPADAGNDESNGDAGHAGDDGSNGDAGDASSAEDAHDGGLAGDAAADVGPPCTDDSDCVSPHECVVGTCDTTAGGCAFDNAVDGTACTNSDPTCVEVAACADGVCVETKKAADCGAKVCGLDACNNSCGICPVGELCDLATGTCSDPAAGCMGIDFLGCCAADGVTLVYCLGGQLVEESCGAGAVCGYNVGVGWLECTTAPEDVPAGEDYICPGQTCETTCDDAGVECGYACGESCGACPVDSYCTPDQACKACGCASEWECGEDPCGASCGTCPSGSTCQSDQTCSAAGDPSADASSGDPDGAEVPDGAEIGPDGAD